MPSVVGLLEEREVAVLRRVESLRDKLDRLVAELEEAEAVRDRLVIAKETVSQVLSESCEPKNVAMSGDARPIVPKPAAPRSVVPVQRDGLDVTVLSPDYRRIMQVLADRERSGEGPAICRQVADALDLELVPAKIEGVRSKAKRLAARGWLVENTPGSFSLAASQGGGS
ncbi:hypothetical protein [Streptomyces sp. ok210]|jgi:hypothetical protein|uniref:hypothetical protein n=1 Tax=Streptomyces sp. ok210 TaxID=1761905 RepID=UPI0008E80A6C|nr:hypothetical protein [Streptomyces sp. ok210]SFT21028.1 hypothetical protein SAMN04487982_11038 [Streptomyces sp. ok210]